MKKSTTKRALIMSVLSMFLCFTMLVGTTFAWFTDEVKSGVNQIVAGNLDVELYNALADDIADSNRITGEATDPKLFDLAAPNLWEPGAVAYENFTVTNEGNLALKYKLSVNIANATGAKNLADVLKVGVVEGGVDVATREEALAKVTSWMPFASFVEEGVLQAKAAGATAYPSATYGVLIWWEPSDKDNDYNMNNDYTDADQLKIEIGVNLFATQASAEKDSFGDDYDANAPFSVWNGTVPATMPETLVVDGATQTVHVKDAAAFAYLSTLSAKWAELYTDGNGRTYTNYANGAGADYYYSGKWTVSLEADIDLNNHPIVPVVLVLGEATGASAFNGNGHTIRNINTTTGLFADKARSTFSNLTLENVKATNGALIGSADNDISNVTVKNATISGADYVGGIVGYSYGAVNGCKVIDSSIVATGKEAGGLIGYVVTSRAEATVAYNTVDNVTVYAGNRAAGLAAQVNVKVKVHNNTINNVTVGAADTTTYQSGAVVSNALAPENVYDNTVTNANVATKAAAVVNNAGLDSAIAGGADTVFLGSGEYIIPDSAKGKTLTIVGNGDTVVASQDDGAAEGDCDYSFDGSTVTFENVTITTSTTYFPGYARMKGIYNNCTINGVWTLYDNSEFNNCEFNVSGDVYNVWTWGAAEATFNNCTFNNDGKAILLYGTANTKLTVNGCTFNDNGGLADLKAAIEIGNDYDKSYQLIVNNTVVNGYEINDKGINTGTTLWANKNSMGTDKLNVVVDGVDIY